MLRLGGDGPEGLEVTLVDGQALIDSIRLEAAAKNPDGLEPGTPIDWPGDTHAWLTFRGTQYSSQFDLEVDGPYLHLDVPAVSVSQMPKRTAVRLWLRYGEGDPFVWAAGEAVWR